MMYLLMCIPGVIMIISGIVISQAKKETTMTRHHFASNFNLKKHSKQIILLFTLTGIAFSLSGMLIVAGKLGMGLAGLFASLIAFIVMFVVIYKRN